MERNLQELYRRVAFNIYIGNTDDHFQTLGQLQNLAVSVGYMMEESTQVDALLSSPSALQNNQSVRKCLRSAESAPRNCLRQRIAKYIQ